MVELNSNKNHLKFFLRLRHELELLPGLELQLDDGGREEEADDDLEDGVLAHAQTAHPQVGQDGLGDWMGYEPVKLIVDVKKIKKQ